MRVVLVVLLAITVTGCATRYTARVPMLVEGYEDERLGLRTWIIRVGAGRTPERPRLRQYAVYRAAEIAIAHGFRYLAVLPDSEPPDDVVVYAPTAPSPSPAGRDPAHEASIGSLMFGHPTEIVRLRIRLIDEREVEYHDIVLEVSKVLGRLHGVVGR